jgi:hypothetical protein
MGLLTLLTLAAVLAASFGYEYGYTILVFFLCIGASIFYTFLAKIFMGLNRTNLNVDVDGFRMIVISLIYTIGVAVTISGPYTLFGMVMLPWVVLNLTSNIFVLLIKFGIIELEEIDDDI